LFLEITGAKAVLTEDYDSTELTAAPGAVVAVVSEVSGWAWCRDADARSGWLPVAKLAPSSEG
jgi:SH3-like domain-containing protein